MTDEQKKENTITFEEETPVTSTHDIIVNGETIHYTATAGRLPLKNEKDEIQAQIFFTAYTKNDVDATSRPLIFSFNGGPGSASIWLHMGALGPKRVVMEPEGWMPKPPFQVEDNPHTLLDLADIVFIDPVGTGYSRALDEEKSKTYWNLKGDIESMGQFIQLYLTRYGRWQSPLFLAGESYGTTRSAGLAGHLIDKGVAFNGILLISTVLNFQTILFGRGNDLPHMLYIPTFAATAWYHGKLAKDLQEKSLSELISEVEEWSISDYWVALARGDSLDDRTTTRIARKLARYTGLSEKYVRQAKLRPEIMHFIQELRREDGITVGRLDSRFDGHASALAISEYPEFDPSMTDITPPYTSVFNQYVRQALGYESDLQYNVLSYDVFGAWEWDRGRYPDTSDALRSALAKNPHMHIYVGQGYYDLATPHFGALYTLNHMDMNPRVKDNIHIEYYEAGHMYYLHTEELAKFKADVVRLFEKAL